MHIRAIRSRRLLTTTALVASLGLLAVPSALAATHGAAPAAAAVTCSPPTTLHITIATPSRVIYPQRATITGRAFQTGGSAACGAAVSVWATPALGKEVRQYASTVGPTGNFSVTLWVGANTTYVGRASYGPPPPPTGLLASSGPHLVDFYPVVGIGSVKPNPVKRGATLYVVGTMAPASLGEKPVLQVFGSNEAWHTVATAYALNSSGVWSLRWLVPAIRHAGTIQVRAILPGTKTHFQGTSSSRAVTIL